MPDFLKMLRRPAREAKVSRAAPLIALAGVGRPIWSSRDTSDLMREGYAKNAVVFRCVRLVAEAAAAIPAYVFRDRDELRNHPLELLLSRPNPRQGGRDLMEQVFTNMLLTGNAYVEMVAEAGVPRELYSLRPDRVKIVPGPDGWPEAYEYTAGGQTIALRCDGEGIPPVLHLKFADPLDDHYGLAPLSAAQVPLDIHNSASAWNKALLDNSARPSGALVYAQGGANMTDEQFARLKEELEGAFSGPLNAGRPMLLEGGLDWKPLALSPRDMDFMAAKSAAAREIALAFGVPPLLLGLPGDNTHANYAEANRALWRQTVIPLARRVTEALAHWLSPGFGGGLRLDLDLDHIEALAEEREAKMKAMLRADYLTVNEKREAIGYGKRPDGDVLVSSRGQVIDLDGLPPEAKAVLVTLLRKFDPNQPRVPAGSADGGQWTDRGGGGGGGPTTTVAANIGIGRLIKQEWFEKGPSAWTLCSYDKVVGLAYEGHVTCPDANIGPLL